MKRTIAMLRLGVTLIGLYALALPMICLDAYAKGTRADGQW